VCVATLFGAVTSWHHHPSRRSPATVAAGIGRKVSLVDDWITPALVGVRKSF
jgi:hypothetical protein